MFSPVSPDGSPARAYAVVRRTRRRGGAVRGAQDACCAREATS